MGVGVQWDDEVMTIDEELADRLFIDAVTIHGPDDGDEDDILRSFGADIQMFRPDQDHPVIGRVAGMIAWSIGEEDVYAAADEISEDVATLGKAVEEIRDHLAYDTDADVIQTCVLIEDLIPADAWHGYNVTGTVVDLLISLLRLDSATTLVVVEPEEQHRVAYEASGFVRWGDSPVWWRPTKLAGRAG